jgi:dihydrolipoamide dehydrogenase
MYDIVIIGSGPAGYTAALESAKRKYKVVLIEKDLHNLGGTCLNEGCIPLKGLLYYSKFLKDYNEIIKVVTDKIKKIREGLLVRLKNAGVDIIEGTASFISKDEIKCNDKNIKAKNFIIATGSAQKQIYNNPNVFNTKKIFNLTKTPFSVLIIGGGAIGCEYASFFNKMGTDTTIVEILPSLLYGEDEELVRTLEREFKKNKIKIFSNSKVAEIKKDGYITIDVNNEKVELKSDFIFEATGRKAQIDELNLDAIGVTKTQKGFIDVNCSMRTNIPNIYAAGDCIETPMLAYTAYAEAEVAVKHIAGENPDPIDYKFIPKIVFSFPQAGSIGFNEIKAQMHKINYNVYKYFFKANGKAVVEGCETGFIKLIEDKEEQRIIGGFVIGDEIVDMMNELSIMINNKIKIYDILKSVHVHPSYSEIIVEALKYGKI